MADAGAWTVTGQGAMAQEFQHRRTGALHLHMDGGEGVKVFGLAVPTAACRDDGVAHATEHLVGCGSARYPGPRPFRAMMSRSLQSYLNNLTFADVTLFMFATSDNGDFLRLLDVYLDGIFFPLLSDEAFGREIHAMSADGRCRPGPIVNEMQLMSRSQGVALERSIGRTLFPASAYVHDHGGRPECLLALTPDDVRTFHRAHYRPERCGFFTSGSLPLELVLDRIDRHVLGGTGVSSAEAETTASDVPSGMSRRYSGVDPAAMFSERHATRAVVFAGCAGDDLDEMDRIRLAADLLFGVHGSVAKALRQGGLAIGNPVAAPLQHQYKRPVLCMAMAGPADLSAEAFEDGVLSAAAMPPEAADWRASVAALAASLIGREGSGLSPGARQIRRLARLPLVPGRRLRALDLEATVALLASEGPEGVAVTVRRHIAENPQRATILLRAEAAGPGRRAALASPPSPVAALPQLALRPDDDHLPCVPLARLVTNCVLRVGRNIAGAGVEAECFDVAGGSIHASLFLRLPPSSPSCAAAIFAGLSPALARLGASVRVRSDDRPVAPFGRLAFDLAFPAEAAAAVAARFVGALQTPLASTSAYTLIPRIRQRVRDRAARDAMGAVANAAAGLARPSAATDRLLGLGAGEQIGAWQDRLRLEHSVALGDLAQALHSVLQAPIQMVLTGPEGTTDRFAEAVGRAIDDADRVPTVSAVCGAPMRCRFYQVPGCTDHEAVAFAVPTLQEPGSASMALLAAFLEEVALGPFVREFLGAYRSSLYCDPEPGALVFAWSPVGGHSAPEVLDRMLAAVETADFTSVPQSVRIAALRQHARLLGLSSARDVSEGFGPTAKLAFRDDLSSLDLDAIRKAARQLRHSEPCHALLRSHGDDLSV